MSSSKYGPMTNDKIQILPLRRAAPPVDWDVSLQAASSKDGSISLPSDDQSLVTKKSRTSKPKVRTGCLTCKIRRVKCDEQKPECNRCVSTGRKCDGYATQPSKKKPSGDAALDILLRKNPASLQGSPAEIRAIEFFYHRTAPQLSSYFDADFWTGLVFQMSHGEDSIRNAMIAVGALAEQRDHGIISVPQIRQKAFTDTTDPLAMSIPIMKNATEANANFALAHYNKGLRALGERIQKPDAPVDVALMACILFVCVEFLRGDVEPAIRHFQSGMNIAISALSSDASQTYLKTVRGIKENMLPFFNRLELLTTLFGNDSSWEYPVNLVEAVSSEFANLRAARDSLVHIMNWTLRFIRHMKYRKYDRVILPEDVAKQDELRKQLDIWKSAFDTFLLSEHITAMDLDGAKILLMHQVITCIWLETSTHADEVYADKFIPQFDTAVSLAEAIQTFAVTRSQGRKFEANFFFDMEVVSPLYFICIKCRHPIIRRRAVALLRKTVRREGLWDSHMAAASSERLMLAEEKNLPTLDGSELPKESDRVHTSHLTSETGAYPLKHTITFFSKPGGLDGEWRIWSEEIVLDKSSVVRGTASDRSSWVTELDASNEWLSDDRSCTASTID